MFSPHWYRSRAWATTSVKEPLRSQRLAIVVGFIPSGRMSVLMTNMGGISTLLRLISVAKLCLSGGCPGVLGDILRELRRLSVDVEVHRIRSGLVGILTRLVKADRLLTGSNWS